MEESANIPEWLQPIIAAAFGGAMGYVLGGGWGLPLGWLIGYAGYWGLNQLTQNDQGPQRVDGFESAQTSHSAHWRDLPSSEQMKVAAKKEKEGELHAARQIYWHLVHKNTIHLTPYRRLASMYRADENFPQLIHVLDHAIHTFKTAPSLDATDRTRAVSQFLKARETALQENNARFRAEPPSRSDTGSGRSSPDA